MTTAEYRDRVKSRFRITGAILDDDIEDCVTDALSYLAPFIQESVVDETLTADSNTETLTIPTAGATLRRMSLRSGTSGLFQPFNDYYVEGDVIYLQSYADDATTVRLHLSVPYSVVADLPATFSQILLLYSCSEFASLLAGDKSRYNIYSQSTGARGVDNMSDLADFYENRGERLARKLATSEVIS